MSVQTGNIDSDSEQSNCPHNSIKNVDKLYGTGKVTFQCKDCGSLVYMEEEEFNNG